MLMVWLGRRGLCLSLPHPFMLEKTLEHLLEERGGKKSHKELQHLCRYRKKNGRLFFKKSQRKLAFFLQTSCLPSGKRLPALSPSLLGRQKALSAGQRPGTPGEGREKAGRRPGARRGTRQQPPVLPEPSSHFKALGFPLNVLPPPLF